jgi:CRISPR-associated protein Cas2
MYLVISYDIPDNLRRNHLSRVLSDFGERKQESLFEARLSESQFQSLLIRINKTIKIPEDDVRIYFLCHNCLEKTMVWGKSGPIQNDPDFYIV